MPAAIAIPLIAGVGGAAASLGAAKIQSNAAKNAAALQVASQDKAQTFNREAFDRQQAALQPYISGGQDAFSRLMSQHFGTGGLSPGMAGTTMQPGQGIVRQGPPPPMPQGAPQWPQGPFQQAMGSPMQAPGGPQGAPMPPGGPQGQPSGRMVQLQGPDGSVKAFPAEAVPGILQTAQSQGHQIRVVG